MSMKDKRRNAGVSRIYIGFQFRSALRVRIRDPKRIDVTSRGSRYITCLSVPGPWLVPRTCRVAEYRSLANRTFAWTLYLGVLSGAKPLFVEEISQISSRWIRAQITLGTAVPRSRAMPFRSVIITSTHNV